MEELLEIKQIPIPAITPHCTTRLSSSLLFIPFGIKPRNQSSLRTMSAFGKIAFHNRSGNRAEQTLHGNVAAFSKRHSTQKASDKIQRQTIRGSIFGADVCSISKRLVRAFASGFIISIESGESWWPATCRCRVHFGEKGPQSSVSRLLIQDVQKHQYPNSVWSKRKNVAALYIPSRNGFNRLRAIRKYTERHCGGPM